MSIAPSSVSSAVPVPLLAGCVCTLAGSGWASDYAASLLGSLGAAVRREDGPAERHPAVAWAQSGAMALTGRADGPPLMCPLPLASCVDGVALAMTALLRAMGGDGRVSLPDAATLGERAALAGLRRQGAISPGGACRLLSAGDGGLAISLPRDDDWALLSAWLEADFPNLSGEPGWKALPALLSGRSVSALVERARLLGLAAARVDVVDPTPVSWCSVASASLPRPSGERERGPLVVDLSSLWAGPLCSHLLQIAGARVVKVESRQRPDGARRGAAAFYDLMNHGKASVALDFASQRGNEQLRALLQRADIVIEASRLRALRQLGIDAEALVAERPGLTWISLIGHGRVEPQGDWIAYGDDAGVAAGLSGVMQTLTGEALFCGDAIADPLTGWHAALVALAGHCAGGGLISLALVDVVRHCARFRLPADAAGLRERWLEWQAVAGDAQAPVPRRAPGAARPLGADTAAVLAELDIPC